MKTFLFAVLLSLAIVAPVMAAAPTQSAKLVLTWQDNSTNEDGFNVERRLGQTGSFTPLATVAKDVATYTDIVANDAGDTEYCYRLNAFNKDGVSAYSNVACGTSPHIVFPPNGAPGGVTVSVTVNVTVNP